ncbi:MAG: hypothetical protein HZA54_12960 [Planctomycetes bacterium]|nr:hypothetical protein [Planctomycetota bacterium]
MQILAYIVMTLRQGGNYVNQSRELRLLASLGIAIYIVCSLVMGVAFSDGMSQMAHENAPELFAAWFNRRLTWGLSFIAVVTLLATIATLFQAAQREEVERLRLLPIPDLPFFAMRVLDICLGVFLFFPLLVALPILRFAVIEGMPLSHALALILGIVLVTLQICFVQMTLAVAAARLVPERMLRHKGVLYAALAVLGLLAYGLAVLAGRRESDVAFLSDVQDALPGKILLFSLSGDATEVWSYLYYAATMTLGFGGLSFLGYSRLYLRRFDLLMDKLVAHDRGAEDRPAVPERLLALLAPLWAGAAGRLLGSPQAGEMQVALVRKELRGTLRDPSVHLVICFALLFVALPGLVFSARAPALGLRVTWFLALGTLLIGNALLAVSSIGREGQGLGLMAGLPLKLDAVLLAKAGAAFLLHGFLAVGLGLGVLFLPFGPAARIGGALYVFAVALALGAVLALLGTGLGAIFPKFDARNQFLAVNRFGVALFFGLTSLLVVSAAVAAAFPVLFGAAWLPVPLGLFALWGFVAAAVHAEGARRLRDHLTMV